MLVVHVQKDWDWGERETTRGKEWGDGLCDFGFDAFRIRCKIEMNAAQLRFRYINLANVKSVQRGRVS